MRREQAHAARLCTVSGERGGQLHDRVDLAAEQRRHHLRGAERHVDDVDAAPALNSATDEMCVWLPVPELPTVIAFGLRLGRGHEIGQASSIANRPRTATTGDSTSTRATGSNASVVERRAWPE